MIVRCSHCSSAFAVNDDKVENKKFAFNCPKCANENVIDNRVGVPLVAAASLKSSAAAVKEADDFSGLPESDGFEASEFNLPSDDAGSGSGFDDEPAVKAGAKTAAADDLSLDDFSLDDIDGIEADSSAPAKGKKDFDESGDLSGISDDELSAVEKDLMDDMGDIPDITEDEIAAAGAAASEKSPADDFSLDDIDSLDIDDGASAKPSRSEKPAVEDEFSLDDIDSLDIDDGASAKPSRSEKPAVEDDFTLDEIDSLDLGDELAVKSDSADKAVVPADDDILKDDIMFDDISDAPEPKPVVDELEPDIALDFNDDFSIEEKGDEKGSEDKTANEIIDDFEPIEEEIFTDKAPVNNDDESITIDLDSLDIDLVEVDSVETKTGKSSVNGDDDITLDLDSLDIDLEEEPVVRKGEVPDDSMLTDDFSPDSGDAGRIKSSAVSDEDDITLNLDELDIPLEETGEIKQGESPDDDDRLTLEDAGLTLDEISAESAHDHEHDDSDDELKLTIDDIDPSLNVDNIHEELDDELKLSIDDIDPSLSVDNLASAHNDHNEIDIDFIDEQLGDLDEILAETSGDSTEPPLSEEPDDLPDIDIDRFFDESGTEVSAGAASASGAAGMVSGARSGSRKRKDAMLDEDLSDIAYDEIKEADAAQASRMVSFTPKGNVNCGIDFSLRFSRLKAVLRLTGLLGLWLIPHFVVIMIYTVLSMILGFLNQLITLFAGRIVEDFTAVQENTLRYTLYINSLMLGAVDEMPVFAGRDNIDHPLQMSAVYPIRNSRLFALLRLSGIGIFIAMVPHIVILTLISIALPIVFIAGQIMVLATARMPHILFDLLNRYFRYLAKTAAFMTGITDAYPPFRFD
jgi:predicted Zn finger-like uncharacterized protein